MKAQKAALRVLGAAGALLFAFFFLLTFWRPTWVESVAAGFIEGQVASDVDARIDALTFEGASAKLSKIAAAIYVANQAQIVKYREQLKLRAHDRIAACIAQLLGLEASARANIARALGEGALENISSLTAINARLTDVIQGKYLRVVAELEHDLRIFTAANFCCFVLLLLATFVRPEATRQLFVPGLLLVLATSYCAYAYLFEQNWLLTIIYSDYLGFAYLGYLALAFLFLCDVVLNYGRITVALGLVFFGLGTLSLPRRRRV
jgi:hypothetical protein